MTHHTPPTNTPAPADGAGEEGLNAEIARALGWTNLMYGSMGTAPLVDLYGIPPSHAELKRVPRYDSDPAACLGLLSYVMALRDEAGSRPTYDVVICQTRFLKQFSVTIKPWATRGCADWHEATAETLEHAIASACRGALAAIAEGVG